MPKNDTRKINLSDVDQRILFGRNGAFLELIKKAFEIEAVDRGELLTLTGTEREVQQAEIVINDL
ncbi:MAG: hypothetical protein L0Y74_07635, partial [candidate division Zixibacteria bacterium]|nr:hypothetical protein [candidate division Zixibacteria bacterium]